ncbi:MAG: Holliday junction resolvase RuvX [Spongiibacteraceae bacterium]
MPETPVPETIVAFDFGTSFIGVAVGQSITGTATPLPALKARDGIPDWAQIEKLIAEWKPQRLLIGLPLNMDGSESEMSARAKKFANRLHGRFGLPCELQDERLSSFEARGELLEQNRANKSAGKKFRERGVDSLSARLILESWFAAQP